MNKLLRSLGMLIAFFTHVVLAQTLVSPFHPDMTLSEVIDLGKEGVVLMEGVQNRQGLIGVYNIYFGNSLSGPFQHIASKAYEFRYTKGPHVDFKIPSGKVRFWRAHKGAIEIDDRAVPATIHTGQDAFRAISHAYPEPLRVRLQNAETIPLEKRSWQSAFTSACSTLVGAAARLLH